MNRIAPLLAAGLFALWLAPARAQSDYQWSWAYDGFSNYQLTTAAAVSSTDVYSGAFPAKDPTLTLQIGKRYAVTNTSGSHPYQIIAKGGTDVVLLGQGSAVGSLESDPDVAWSDAGTLVTFTMTQSLLTAMQQGGRIPGYRCGVHTGNMRGDFNVIAGTTPSPTPTPAPTETPYDGRAVADFNGDHCTELNDFLFLLDNWQVDVGGTVVGLDDFLAMLDNWFIGSGC